ncbi:CPBP family intramembrane glutamic endopeptidase [Acrocarpospora sp. B8E8]|uniref:CPBP family intramembrane glutamic endopeptidase n=1 Tax=Acrocarpospora sp. B8E8 TaxID=3153572 RepID=UPI00325E787E
MAGMKAVAVCCGVLAGANVMNNVVAKRWAPATSALATGALLGIALREGVRGEELGFERWKEGAALGGGLAVAVAVTYAAGIGLPRTRSLFRDERALALSRSRLLEEALLQVPVGTVMLEEIAFRGVLPALLSRMTRARTAAAISSALFGLWHILPALDMARANPSLTRLAGAGLDPTPDLSPSDADRGPHASRAEGKEDRTHMPNAVHASRDQGEGQVPSAVNVDGEEGAGQIPSTADEGKSKADLARLVIGTVVATSMVGGLFLGLRRRGGLLAPALVHIATNSFGYAAARLARRIDARSES